MTPKARLSDARYSEHLLKRVNKIFKQWRDNYFSFFPRTGRRGLPGYLANSPECDPRVKSPNKIPEQVNVDAWKADLKTLRMFICKTAETEIKLKLYFYLYKNRFCVFFAH